MDWSSLLKWIPVIGPVVSAIAQAIIEGSRAAGVTHETVALTIAKAVLHINGVTKAAPQNRRRLPRTAFRARDRSPTAPRARSRRSRLDCHR